MVHRSHEAPREGPEPDDSSDDDRDADDAAGRLARAVGSDRTIVWAKRIAMAVALAFLVGAFGYFLGVRTSEVPSNAVDIGFLQDMTDHHDQAVQLAKLELANGSDPVAKSFAMEVLLFQRFELGRLQNFQNDHGVTQPEYDLERSTMGWMDMATPLRQMPGMATDAQIDQLEAARGVEADRLFLTLMQAHHEGGAHMADWEARYGADPRIRELADRMARNQRIEVKEYQTVLDRLPAA